MRCHCLVSKQLEMPEKALCAINKFGLSFFAMYNLHSQAVYLHHKPHSSWTAKHLFQVQLPFSHRHLCFQDQSESPSTCPRPACCNLSLRTSSLHTCEACYLWDSQGPSPWPSGDSRGYTRLSIMQLWQIQLDLGSEKRAVAFFPHRSSHWCWGVHHGMWAQVSSFMRHESYHSLSPCDWRYNTLTGVEQWLQSPSANLV